MSANVDDGNGLCDCSKLDDQGTHDFAGVQVEVDSNSCSHLRFLRQEVLKWDIGKLLSEFSDSNRLLWETIVGAGVANPSGQLFEQVLALLARSDVSEHSPALVLYLPLLTSECTLALHAYVSKLTFHDGLTPKFIHSEHCRGVGTRSEVMRNASALVTVLTILMRSFEEQQLKLGPLCTRLHSSIAFLTGISEDSLQSLNHDDDNTELWSALISQHCSHLSATGADQAISSALSLFRKLDSLISMHRCALVSQETAAIHEVECRHRDDQSVRAAADLARAGVTILDQPARDKDFLSTFISPTMEDLLFQAGPIELPVNIVNWSSNFDSSCVFGSSLDSDVDAAEQPSAGKYRNGFHLLNTHFLLLREECWSQVRIGLGVFKNKYDEAGGVRNVNSFTIAANHLNAVRNRIGCQLNVYTHVRVVDINSLQSKLSYMIEFAIPGVAAIDSVKTSRLLAGNLICLIAGPLLTEKSLVLGSVILGVSATNLEPELPTRLFQTDCSVQKSRFLRVCISIEADSVQHFDPTLEFIMLESPINFVAHKHSLTAIQAMPRFGSLPFESVLLGQSRLIDDLQYLRRAPAVALESHSRVTGRFIAAASGHRCTSGLKQGWEMSSVFPKFQLCTGSSHWDPSVTAELPAFECDPPLDQSQRAAITMALCKQVSLIQGPPGTGKTSIGVLISRILLANKGIVSSKPIVVICQTDHTLEQFLDMLYQYDKNFISIGSCSLGSRAASSTMYKKRLAKFESGVIDETWADGFFKRSLALRGLGLAFNQRFLLNLTLNNADQRVIFNGSIARLRTILASLYADSSENPIDNIMRFTSDVEVRAWKLIQSNLSPLNFSWASSLSEWQKLSVESRVDLLSRYDFSARSPTNAGLQILNAWACSLEESVSNRNSNSEPPVPSKGYVVHACSTDRSCEVDSDADLLSYRFAYNENANDLTSIHDWDRVDRDLAAELSRPLDDAEVQQLIQAANVTESELRFMKQNDILHDTMNLAVYDRQRLICLWHKLLRSDALINIQRFSEQYEDSNRVIQQRQLIADELLLSKANVIGLTAANAAKHHALFQRLGCEVLLVDEAEQVLEAQLLTALTPSIKQLILIGDYFQLRPRLSTPSLQQFHAFNVSLFERLIRAGVAHVTLSTQDIMHPEISALLRSSFYPTFVDAVLSHPQPISGISGMLHPVFLWSHSGPEDDNFPLLKAATNNGFGLQYGSQINSHEAAMIVRLMQHLLMNGYASDQIVVLTLFKDQTNLIRRMVKDLQSHLYGLVAQSCQSIYKVRIATVDKFQSQHADIILLSLVRSHLPHGQFDADISDLNSRINVGLSRARQGLFVLGNFSLLQQQSICLRKLGVVMQERGQLSPKLPLKCSRHPTSPPIFVAGADDFNNSPHGGCLIPCGGSFKCGHSCDLVCHYNYRSHDDLKCYKACQKPQPSGCSHPCPLQCWQPCGPCKVPIVRTRALCQHSFRALCGDKINSNPCPLVCGIKNPCGHTCQEPCKDFRPHTTSSHPCKSPCDRKRSTCSHACLKLCSDVCEKCTVVSSRVLSCGHTVTASCSEADSALIAKCKQPCQKTKFECGHFCAKLCNEPCESHCSSLVTKDVPSCLAEVQHSVKVQCSLAMSSSPCDVVCQSKLDCGHQCTGKCGTCLSSGIHNGCSVVCDRKLLCGHTCSTQHSCSTRCPPCASPCSIACVHRQGCGRSCSEPCKPCEHTTKLACQHAPEKVAVICNQLLHDNECSDQFCTQRCPMLLRCGHACLGVCGEICPTVCVICDLQSCQRIVPTHFSLRKPELFRLVQLQCGHTFEFNFLLKWIKKFAIKPVSHRLFPQCPTCQSRISGVQRFDYLLAEIGHAMQQFRLPALELEMRTEFKSDLDAGLVDLVLLRLQSAVSQCSEETNNPLVALYQVFLGSAFLAKTDRTSAEHAWKIADERAIEPAHRFEAKFNLAKLELAFDEGMPNKAESFYNLTSQSLSNARQLLQSCVEGKWPKSKKLQSCVLAAIKWQKEQHAARNRAAAEALTESNSEISVPAISSSTDILVSNPPIEHADASNQTQSTIGVETDAQAADLVVKSGGSILHLVARLGKLKEVKSLLVDGADINAADKNGDTALHLAVRFRHLPVVQLLLPLSSWNSISQSYRKTAVEEALVGPDSQPLADPTAAYIRSTLQSILRGVHPFKKSSKRIDASRKWAAMRTLESIKCDALDELMSMIGLKSVKDEALKLLCNARIDKLRPEASRTCTKQALNFVFMGNPGSGKTSVARLFGKMLQELELRPKNGSFVETTGQKLSSECEIFSSKFADVIKSATPGVLFIDEAAPLSGKTTLTSMIMEATENHRQTLSIIVTGNPAGLRQWLDGTPGLSERFPFQLHFEDFNEKELKTLFVDHVRTVGWKIEQVVANTTQSNQSVSSKNDVSLMAARRLARGAGRPGFSNARSVRVMVEAAQRRASERILSNGSKDDLITLTRHDILGAPLDPDSSPLLKKLFGMTGLGAVKSAVRSLVQLATDNFIREEAGLRPLDVALHRLFLGNPGTGKTTVAKMYGQVLREMGFLSNGEVIVIGASKLIGKYTGFTSALVNETLDKARGKVLVIDEAYALQNSDFGKEALDTLVERVQGTPGEDFAVLLCGYEPQMAKMFRDCNPGLQRRWRMEDSFKFEDYSDAELVEIMLQQAKEAAVSVSREVAEAATREVLSKLRSKPNFGNAGSTRNLLDSAKEKMSRRIREQGGNPLQAVLEECDFFESKNPNAARDSLSKLVNAGPILRRIEQLEKQIKAQKARGTLDPKKLLRNWRFVGPPGTGKTTVARAFGEVFHQLGLLADSCVTECKAMDLIAEYIGQTAPLVNSKMNEARGGVLFIDEAYALCESKYGSDAIDALVSNMTDPIYEGNMIIIVAGYRDRIDTLMRKNVGLRSRFTEQLDFTDWSSQSCLELVTSRCSAQQVELISGNTDSILAGFERLRQLPGWANARDAITVADKLLESRDLRSDDNGLVEGPLLLSDIQHVFDEFINQRTTTDLVSGHGQLHSLISKHIRSGGTEDM